MDLPSLTRETSYGMPAADQIILNRHYALGYSYYFRQAKWALEIINLEDMVERSENFRPDYRIPEMFRADLEDYKGSKHDRGHLVASANRRSVELENSETFLLSNMSPQNPQFNQGIWKDLEGAVRKLAEKEKILETYVICGPLFYFDQPVKFIGYGTKNEVAVPVPNAFFKSILAEYRTGRLEMRSFILPNEPSDDPLEKFRVPTTEVERKAGIQLWSRLEGTKIKREKNRTRKMW